MEDNFLRIAKQLIDDLKEYKDEYTSNEYNRIIDLEKIAKTNRKEFVKKYKKLSGATDWDLPDVIYLES